MLRDDLEAYLSLVTTRDSAYERASAARKAVEEDAMRRATRRIKPRDWAYSPEHQACQTAAQAAYDAVYGPYTRILEIHDGLRRRLKAASWNEVAALPGAVIGRSSERHSKSVEGEGRFLDTEVTVIEMETLTIHGFGVVQSRPLGSYDRCVDSSRDYPGDWRG